MAGGYDEWAAARTPSLLAFAAALIEDHEAAEAAVARALARTRSAWGRVSRDDPDLHARRHVVRTCATPRRAAVVLHLLEERSDAEIADVLDCSEAVVRRHLLRGLGEAARRGGSAQPSALRDDLAARAGAAPTQLLTRPAATLAPEEPARRRRSTWLSAVAVVALVGGVSYVSHESRTPDGVFTYPKVTVPHSWRFESYAGVQLRVPDTWGWGAAPVHASYFAGKHHLGACGTDQAAVLSPADSAQYVTAETDFVGRPAVLTNRCVPWGSDGVMPPGNAVWFSSPLPVGVRPEGSTVAETRAVGSQHVTVFSPQPALRREILGTVEAVGDVDANGCPTRPVVRPRGGSAAPRPDSLSVCVYSQDTGVATLLWSGTVGSAQAREYATAFAAGAGTGPDPSCPTPSGQWVALGLRGDGDTRWDVVNLRCSRVQGAGGASAALTPELVRGWAWGGASAYVGLPGGSPALASYFRAPVG